MSDLEMPGARVEQWIRDHIKLYLENPEAAHLYEGLPTLLLIARGRKSGKRRPMPLIYGKAGDAYVIVASKAGAPQHPDWYENLVANPDCEIRVGATRLNARARTASAAEHGKLWPQMVRIYPEYDDYQKAAVQRQIPIVLLEPTGPATD